MGLAQEDGESGMGGWTYPAFCPCRCVQNLEMYPGFSSCLFVCSQRLTRLFMNSFYALAGMGCGASQFFKGHWNGNHFLACKRFGLDEEFLAIALVAGFSGYAPSSSQYWPFAKHGALMSLCKLFAVLDTFAIKGYSRDCGGTGVKLTK